MLSQSQGIMHSQDQEFFSICKIFSLQFSLFSQNDALNLI